MAMCVICSKKRVVKKAFLRMTQNGHKRWKKLHTRQQGAALRDMFASMLMFCEVTDPRALWDQHYTTLSNDIMHRIATSSVSRRSHQQLSAIDVLNETLHDLDRILQRNSTSLSNFPSLPQADGGSILAPQPNRLIHEE
jgi:hypothetical protein